MLRTGKRPMGSKSKGDIFFEILYNTDHDKYFLRYGKMKNSDKGKKLPTNYSSELRNHDIKLNKSENKHKQVQGMIGESETRFKSLYTMVRLMCDNVPDLIWAKDLQKQYVFVNRAICDQLLNAKDTDEPMGKTDMFFADRERLSRPDNPSWHTFGEICTDSDAVVLETRRPQRFDEFGDG